MTSSNKGFGDCSHQPLGLEGNMAVTRAGLGLLKPLISFVQMLWELGIDPVSLKNKKCPPKEKIGDGLFMMQHRIPNKVQDGANP